MHLHVTPTHSSALTGFIVVGKLVISLAEIKAICETLVLRGLFEEAANEVLGEMLR